VGTLYDNGGSSTRWSEDDRHGKPTLAARWPITPKPERGSIRRRRPVFHAGYQRPRVTSDRESGTRAAEKFHHADLLRCQTRWAQRSAPSSICGCRSATRSRGEDQCSSSPPRILENDRLSMIAQAGHVYIQCARLSTARLLMRRWRPMRVRLSSHGSAIRNGGPAIAPGLGRSAGVD